MENDIVLQTIIRSAIKTGSIFKKVFISGAIVGTEKGSDYYDVVSRADIVGEFIVSLTVTCGIFLCFNFNNA